MNDEQIRKHLEKLCKKAGSQKIWAEKNKLSEAYVSDLIHGRRSLSKKILDKLGYAYVPTYKAKLEMKFEDM